VTSTDAIDFDALETCLRTQALEIGRVALQTGLQRYAAIAAVSPGPRVCGHIPHRTGIRAKTVHTVLGPVRFHRPYYHDAPCGCGFAPLDRLLDVEGISFSPGLRNMMANVGCSGAFDQAARQLARLAGVTVSASSIERVCAHVAPEVEHYRRSLPPNSDLRAIASVLKTQTLYIQLDGTGFPVLKRETAGRKGKGADGEARTREMKVGCVFTQSRLNEEGYPVRDEASTSYIAGCITAAEFGQWLAHEARVRGFDKVRRVVVIGDGALWIWNLVADLFPFAIPIVDLYHAREHYAAIARLVFPATSARLEEWCEHRKQELDRGDVSAVIAAIAALPMSNKQRRKEQENAIGYFRNNSHRMRYDVFRKQGLFVGSGVIEAGCKTVVGQRLKQSGMHWTVQAGHNIAGLRTLMLSKRWDDFWEARVAA
jgi:hypothetical protein